MSVERARAFSVTPRRAMATPLVTGLTVAAAALAMLACVGAARQAALLAFGADPETAAPAERRGKGLAKASRRRAPTSASSRRRCPASRPT